MRSREYDFGDFYNLQDLGFYWICDLSIWALHCNQFMSAVQAPEADSRELLTNAFNGISPISGRAFDFLHSPA